MWVQPNKWSLDFAIFIWWLMEGSDDGLDPLLCWVQWCVLELLVRIKCLLLVFWPFFSLSAGLLLLLSLLSPLFVDIKVCVCAYVCLVYTGLSSVTKDHLLLVQLEMIASQPDWLCVSTPFGIWRKSSWNSCSECCFLEEEMRKENLKMYFILRSPR